ncbi:MAG: rhodanese-like domain-containing protein [Nitrospirales bacterium]|nr:rhodanese-like domain-containing protein [Nitrospirales bacterium]
MKGKRFFAAAAATALILTGAAYTQLSASNGTDTILMAVEKAFDLIPEDAYLLTAEDLNNRIKSGKKDFVIVDTRPHWEDYEEGHIPGAIYIPWREIMFPDSLKQLPKDKDIILYCSTGHVENQSLMGLRTVGYKAYALRWGMLSWGKTKHTEKAIEEIRAGEKSGFPVEKGMDRRLKEERQRRAIEHTGC